MSAHLRLLLLTGILLAPNIHAQSPAKPRTDALGDPLPGGAIARLGTLRFKHAPAGNQTIDTALFSPDGSKIVSMVSSAGSIRLWDAASGKEIAGPWNSANRYYTAVAFSPDGAVLAAAAGTDLRNNFRNGIASGTIILYDIARANQVKTLSAPSQTVQALAFADGGKTLVAAGTGTVRWWDVATGKEQRSWQPLADERSKNGKTFSYCAMAPGAQAIAVIVGGDKENNGGVYRRQSAGTVAKEAMGFDLATRQKCWHWTGKGALYEKNHFFFSADGKRVAIAMGSDTVQLRDAVTGKLLMKPLESKLAGNNRLGGVALSSDASMVAVASKDSDVQIWNAKDANEPRQFAARIAQNGSESTAYLHFSPDNKKLLVAVDADLQIYDVATLQEVRPAEGHRGWVDHLAFTPDGKRLLTGSSGNGAPVAEYFGPNGRVYFLIYTGHRGQLPSLEQAAWDVATWKRVQLTSARAAPWPNFGSASLQQTVYVGKSGEDRFGLFDVKSGQLLARMRLPEKKLTTGGGFFSPGGKHYVRYANDNNGGVTECVYAVPSGKLVCQMPSGDPNQNRRGARLSETPADPSNNIAFSQDERLVAQFGRGDGRIHVFDTTIGKLRHSLGEKLEVEGPVFDIFSYDAAFSSDGKFLATWSSLEKAIRVWDVATGMDLTRITPDEIGPDNPNYGQRRINLAWSADGRVLAVADNKIRLWEVATLGVRHELAGHKDGPIRALAFAPDGQVLASASADTTVLIWDMAMSDRPLSAARDSGALEKRWQALAVTDAAPAFAAILDLAATPKESIAWISARLEPAAAIDPKRIEQLIADLNDNQYRVRQSATAELLQIGERVVPAIDKALAAKPSLETQLRLRDARKRLLSPVLKSEQLRTFRAVEVLERIGTHAARQVLQTLAGGAPGAMLTTQARAALERLPK